MIADLKPYPAMKNSGVPWLGEVPEHWEVRRLKQAFTRIVGGSTPSSAESSFWDGDVVWATPADVSKNSRLRDSLRRITRDGLRLCSSELVPAGSLVVTSRAPVGNVAIAETELCTNQGCKALVATPAVVHSVFGYHVLTMLKDELRSLGSGTTFTEVSTSRIGTVSMPVPPLPEQAAIVRFLDHADRRIRRYIRAKQKLIKLLEEQKQAIIHRAVTRGLDPNVRLKPSGVPWLGEVPEHWEVRKLKYAVTFSGGGTPSKAVASFWNGHIPWVSPKDMTRPWITDATDHINDEAVAASATSMVPPGALLMVVRSGILRRAIPVAINAVVVAFNQDMKALRPRRGVVEVEYLRALVEGNEASLIAEWTKQGATVESVEHEFLSNSQVPLPPLPEQAAIVRLLDEETTNIPTATAPA